MVGMDKEMKSYWIEDIKEFGDVAKEWDEALIASGENNPFLLYDFITTWWEYYSPGRNLMIYVIREGKKIVAGIPLCMERRNFRKTIVHVGGCNANVTHFFSRDKELDFAKNLMASLEKRNDWDIFILDRVLSTNPFARHISPNSKFICYTFNADSNGIIDLTGGYEKVFKNLNKRLQRYLKSAKHQAADKGGFKLHRISGESNLRKLFKEFKALSIKSFRTRNSISAFEDGSCGKFFEELFVKHDKKKRLDAHKLTMASDTLGISFGYRFGKGFKWILTTFNPDFYKLRPGYLLLEALVNEAIDRGDPYFDMYYGGEMFYKKQWSTKTIPLKRIEICRNNLLNRSISYTRNVFRRNKVFMDTARKIRDLFKGTKKPDMSF